MSKSIKTILDTNPDLRVSFKELPIFGGVSNFAAKAALASHKQNKYLTFHEALMAVKAPLTEEKILSTAKMAGLNVEQLQKDMGDSQVAQAIEENIAMATALGLTGTPAFFISPKNITADKINFIPGAVDTEKLQQAISHAK